MHPMNLATHDQISSLTLSGLVVVGVCVLVAVAP